MGELVRMGVDQTLSEIPNSPPVRAVRGLAAGTFQLSKATWGALEMVGDALGISSLTSWAKDARKGADDVQAATRGNPNTVTDLERTVYSGFESIGATATSLAAGAVTGSPRVTLGIMGAQTALPEYSDARAAGANPLKAATFAISQGAVEVVTERIPASKLLTDLAQGSKLLPTIMRQMIEEVPNEQAATFFQDLNQWATIDSNKGKPFAAYVAERPSAAADTFVATLVATIGQTAGAVGAQRLLQPRTSADVIREGPGGAAAEEVVAEQVAKATAPPAPPPAPVQTAVPAPDGPARGLSPEQHTRLTGLGYDPSTLTLVDAQEILRTGEAPTTPAPTTAQNPDAMSIEALRANERAHDEDPELRRRRDAMIAQAAQAKDTQEARPRGGAVLAPPTGTITERAAAVMEANPDVTAEQLQETLQIPTFGAARNLWLGIRRQQGLEPAAPETPTPTPAPVDTAATQAQTVQDVTPAGPGDSEATGGRRRTNARRIPDRLPADTRFRRGEARPATLADVDTHYADLDASVVEAASEVDPQADPADVLDEFHFRLELYRDQQRAEKDAGRDPVDLLRAIADAGGISEIDNGKGMHGELERLRDGTKGKQGAFGRFAGMPGIFRARTYDDQGAPATGLGLDIMVQRLQQDDRFSWIETPDDLIKALDAIGRDGADSADMMPGSDTLRDAIGVDLDSDWWSERWRPAPEQVEASDDAPDADVDFDPTALDAMPRKRITEMTPDEYTEATSQGTHVFDSLYRVGAPQTDGMFLARGQRALDSLAGGAEGSAVAYHGVQFDNPLVADDHAAASMAVLGRNLYEGIGKATVGERSERSAAILAADSALGAAARAAGYDAIVTPDEVQALDLTKLPDPEPTNGEEYDGIGFERAAERQRPVAAPTPKKAKKAKATKPAEAPRAPQPLSADALQSEMGLSPEQSAVTMALLENMLDPQHFAQIEIVKGGTPDPDALRQGTSPENASAALAKEFSGVDFYLGGHANGDWFLSGLIVPPADRGRGVGTRFMERLVSLADEAGVRVVLSPAQRGDPGGTTSRDRLVRFYQQFGFVENKGRRKDFRLSDGMYRSPRGQARRLYQDDATAMPMSKRDVEAMLERAWNAVGKPYFDPDDPADPKTWREWIPKRGAEDVALTIDSNYELNTRYVAPLGEDVYLQDILKAYEDGTLPETAQKAAASKTPPVTMRDVPFVEGGRIGEPARRAPMDAAALKQAWATASQRSSPTRAKEINQARKALLVQWHVDPGMAATLGVKPADITKAMRTWSGYPAKAAELQGRLNRDVPPVSEWTGVSNMAWLSRSSVTPTDVDAFVKTITAGAGWNTPRGEDLRAYLVRVFLGIDTRIDYSDLAIDVDSSLKPLGQYSQRQTRITMRANSPHTFAHEIGHYLDNKWSREMGVDGFLSDASINWDIAAAKTSQERVQWAKRMMEFVRDLSDRSDIRSEYTQARKEVFARFTDQFVRWVETQAGSRSWGESYYSDRFTTGDYTRFVGLLQEKAFIDAQDGNPLAGFNGKSDAAPVDNRGLFDDDTDTNEFGEAQPRLPGDVGAVRNEERPTPKLSDIEDEFRLTPQYDKRRAKQNVLFQTEDAAAVLPNGFWYFDNILSALPQWQAKGTPEQLIAHLKKTKGAMDEAVDIRLPDWLAGKKSVTRAEVQAFVEANKIQIEETVLGGVSGGMNQREESIVAALDEKGYEVREDEIDGTPYLSMNGEGLELDDVPADILRLWEELQSLPTARSNSKFEGYQLAGQKENYREILLTLPEPPAEQFNPAKVRIERHRQSVTQGSVTLYYDGEKLQNYGDDIQMRDGQFQGRADDYWMDTAKRLFEKGDQRNGVRQRSSAYQSSHFDQPNILLHTRVNDRTLADGRKVLFVEEIQSDWHQAGRRQGYQAARETFDAWRKRMEDATGQPVADNPQERDLWRNDTSYSAMRAGGVPDAPFKNDGWKKLALKRLLAYAAEGGYDGIAWTTGEQQAERYDLSKQVDKIGYRRRHDGKFDVYVYQRGRLVDNSQFIGTDAEKLESIVGKEIAQRIVEGAGTEEISDSEQRLRQRGKAVEAFLDTSTGARGSTWGIRYEDGSEMFSWPSKEAATRDMDRQNASLRDDPERTLEGVDLKVGGEGMKGFYDRELVNLANDLAKKHGQRVGRGEVVTHDSQILTPTQQGVTRGRWGILDHITTELWMDPRTANEPTFNTRAEAVAAINAMGKAGVGQSAPVHVLATPQAMRDEIRAKGVPLFQAAWHGSPHEFEEFSLHKIGTGEGAQSYGWGLYFAGDKAVAEYYRDTLKAHRLVRADGTPLTPEGSSFGDEATAFDILDNHKRHSDPFASALNVIGEGQNEWERARVKKLGDIIRRWQAEGVTSKSTGRVYKVDIPEGDAYLHFDKPLSEQPARFLKELSQYGATPDMDGGLAYRKMSEYFDSRRNPRVPFEQMKPSHQIASERLARVGIAGIRYPDANSRGGGKKHEVRWDKTGTKAEVVLRTAPSQVVKTFDSFKEADAWVDANGERTYNYVVFDDKLVKILEFEQRQPQGKKGAIVLDMSKALIHAFESADVSTAVHEAAHVARRWLLNREVPQNLRQGISDEDIAVAEKWAGAKDGVWDTKAEEKFARGFEHYLREGGPSLPTQIREVFKKLASWLADIYQTVQGSAIDVEISPEMRAVFDKLVTRVERNKAATAKAASPVEAAAATAPKPATTPRTPERFESLKTPRGGETFATRKAAVEAAKDAKAAGRTIKRIVPDGARWRVHLAVPPSSAVVEAAPSGRMNNREVLADAARSLKAGAALTPEDAEILRDLASEEADANAGAIDVTPPPPGASSVEPWQQTRAQFRAAEMTPYVDGIKAAIRAGKSLAVRTQLRIMPLRKADEILITGSGVVKVPNGRTLVTLTDDQVFDLARQAGMNPPSPMEREYHGDLVRRAADAGKPIPEAVRAEYAKELADVAQTGYTPRQPKPGQTFNVFRVNAKGRTQYAGGVDFTGADWVDAKDKAALTPAQVYEILDLAANESDIRIVDSEDIFDSYDASDVRGYTGQDANDDATWDASLAWNAPKVDKTAAGAQTRLPGDVGNVRDEERAQPTEDVPEQTLRLSAQQQEPTQSGLGLDPIGRVEQRARTRMKDRGTTETLFQAATKAPRLADLETAIGAAGIDQLVAEMDGEVRYEDRRLTKDLDGRSAGRYDSRTRVAFRDVVAWLRSSDPDTVQDAEYRALLAKARAAIGGGVLYQDADQTGTPAFQRWFQRSQIFDPRTRKPLVLYHGTPSKFDTFDTKRRGLIYLTTSREEAEVWGGSRSEDDGADVQVMDLYASIQNPIEIDNFDGIVDWTNQDRARYEKQGYDGAIFRDDGETIVVAFRPEQVKSATGNSGAFDAGNPSTLYQADADPLPLTRDDRDDLVVIGAAKLARGLDRKAWDAAMRREFGPKIGPLLNDLHALATARAKVAQEVDVEDYFNLRRLDVSADEKQEISAAILETIYRTGRVPKERESWESIRAEAKEMAPEVLEQLAPFQQMQAPFRAVRLIARERIARLNQEVYEGRMALEGIPGDSPEALQRERVLAAKERDLQGLLDVWMRQRSEDGRNLAMHRMTVNSLETWYDPTFWYSKARRELGLPVGTQLPVDVWRALQDILNRGRQAVETGQPVEPIQLELSRYLTRLQKSTWLEVISAVRKAGLLTGPKTHARNVLGNLAFATLEELSRIPAVLIDFAVGTVTGHRTVHGVSPRAIANASREAATKGIAEARDIFRTGSTASSLMQVDARRELNSGMPWLDTYVNTVFRAMGATDRVFKSYAFRRSMEEQAALEAINRGVSPIEILAHPPAEMLARAVADAEFATFNNKNVIAEFVTGGKAKMQRHPGQAGKVAAFAIDMAVPFVNTPSNILARMLDYTPGGASIAVTRAAIQVAVNKSLTAEQQRIFTQGIGRGATGSALIYLGFMLAAAGMASGMGGDDEGDRNVKEAAGVLPGAVKINGRWHQIATFSPAGNLVSLGASIHRSATMPLKDELMRGTKIAAVAARLALDQPMLKGMSDLIASLQRPEARAEAFAAGMAGSFVPTLVNDVASAFDPYRRDTRPEGGFRHSLWTGVAARLPGARNLLPSRLTVLGDQQEQTARAIWDPTIATVARDLQDDVLRELITHDVGITWPRQTKDETADSYRQRVITTGAEIKTRVGRVIASPAYRQRSDEQQAEMIGKAIDDARRIARERQKRSGPPMRPRFQ